MNKKGLFLENAVLYGITAFMIAVVSIFMIIIVGKFNDGIQATNTTLIDQEIKDISANQNSKFTNLDRAFGFLFLGFLIMSIIAARKLDEVQPLYIIFGILGLIAIGLFGMIVENIWSGFIVESNIASTTNSLVFIPFIMNNLLISLIVYVALVVIARLSRDVGGGI